MEFEAAQHDMRRAYIGGSTGVLISGLVWCIAGWVALISSQQNSMYALFIGGIFIHPASVLLDKILKATGSHNPKNPLGKLAFESTVILFVGLFLAFTVAKIKVEWFYPIMLMTIGVRYLTFQTLFGMRTYWILGFTLMLAGALCVVFKAPFVYGAFIGGGTEIAFSLLLFKQSKIDSLHPNTD